MDTVLHPIRAVKEEKENREGRKEKRMSLAGKQSSHSKDRKSSASPRLGPRPPVQLSAIIESPPLVLFGPSTGSTGALLSGRLKLDVIDPTGQIKVHELSMQLLAEIVLKKPVVKDCADCSRRSNQLTEWKFLSEPKTFHKAPADYQFPFSFLFPGHLPATTHTSLASIEYMLSARALTSTGEVIKFSHPLKVQRAIPPGPDKASIRIFPPTHLAARVVLPPVIHPIGSFPVQMVLSGVVDKKTETQTRWRLRKMMWRIEEHQKMTSPACTKHQSKLGEGKALQHTDTRIVGSDEAKSGWKTDFDTAGGEIHMEFDANLDPTKHPICDVESPAGLEVKHNLVMELIVAEEFCPNKNTRMITPTGAARVLRMQFNLNVTERAGMGISWDEEMPPVYEDVPESPPGYKYADAPGEECTITDYTGEELEYEELERMHSENPNDPPIYRERTPVLKPLGGLSRGESSQNPLPRGERRATSMSSSTLSPRILAQSGFHNTAQGAGGSAHWTENDFEAEPPQYSLNNLRIDDAAESTDSVDVAQGESA
ncbi:putative arrestin (or s-antigen) n-terminal domain protein [Phaeomoniella chlamydospora]|uniref:Putative arrestin (Or s-antigen) n-terminal domain protein n=1 Tax=Phaeomoniella chlamydospora TaxID=158046 RepID=A0A0G2GXS4_PHACM|nr:putative arrestin (or s-antigen) n-terminal domain protein [Phaeomoniella chlamydospora]